MTLTVENFTDSYVSHSFFHVYGFSDFSKASSSLCLAYVDTSTVTWRCVDNSLTGTGTTRTGTTWHFTSFGVIITPTGGSGGDGDGFDTVLVAPIVISVVFAIFVVVVVVVVGTTVGLILRARRRRKLMGGCALATDGSVL